MRKNFPPSPCIGIDDMSVYVPKIFLPIETLSVSRNIEFGKLYNGLGLEGMALADVHEDTATMAANAIYDLMAKNNLDPRKIGRIYLGTESALDDAKPTATYALEMLSQVFSKEYGSDCFLNCDVVDMTFACIGGVDALQNTIDWVAGEEDRIGIVVTSDNAKYEMGSTGEYTQGAGAIALLITHQPRLLALHNTWGVATKPVHDFFKPKREAQKKDLFEEVLKLANVSGVDVDAVLEQLDSTIEVNGLLDSNETKVSFYKSTPVFNGPQSNKCYQERILEAFKDYSHKASKKGMGPNGKTLTETWERIIFHLPYAYQGRRMFAEIFYLELINAGKWSAIEADTGIHPPAREGYESEDSYQRAYGHFLRLLGKSSAYKKFVAEKIEKGERASSKVGNMYTGSIFLSLMSTLSADLQDGAEMEGKAIGFFAYGSGSKSKVFEGVVMPEWAERVRQFSLFEILAERHAIDYDTYELLHRGKLAESIHPTNSEFGIAQKDDSKGLPGERHYEWKSAVPHPAR
jgi:hydroxymethylglutaryl-CoA synthase